MANAILVTNDDGVESPGLRLLALALAAVAPTTVVAPASEQSAVGTAVSLRQRLTVKEVSQVIGLPAFSVSGTPSDCVILGLEKLLEGNVGLVVSGINDGQNLGEDVLISGTVSAAMQAYLRGHPALAVSAPYGGDSAQKELAAQVAARLARSILDNPRLDEVFLNVNIPDTPPEKVKGIKVTRLAAASHINTVEERKHGNERFYQLLRERSPTSREAGSDIRAVEHGYISITPLYTRRFDKSLLPELTRLVTALGNAVP